jgi:biopolymer transport protein ExbB
MDEALDFITQLMERGGPVMWPIALCSLITVIVSLRKALQWTFMMLHAHVGAKTWSDVLKTFSQGDKEATLTALKQCHSPYAPLLSQALTHPDLPFAEALETVARAYVRKLASGLGVLDTIVTLAPMLGILGTVTGIIDSFNLMGSVGADDPTGIASGIAEALITTAAGLVVSILALIPLNTGRIWHKTLTTNVENAMTAVETAARKA